MKSWPTKKLGGICLINMGQSPSSSTYNSNQEGLPFFQGKKDYGEKHPTPNTWCSAPIKIVDVGDVLISVRAPVGALNVAKEKSCIGRGLAGLRSGEGLDQSFLFYFLREKEKYIASLGTGSTFTAISKKHLENLEIPFPPLVEQKKIVAKLEKLLAKIKEVKRLRVEARAATLSLFSAELHKIFEEGKKKGWDEKEIEQIAEKVEYGTSQKTSDLGEVAVFRMNNIQNGLLDLNKLKYLSQTAQDLPKLYLKSGDILFNRTNSPELVGKTAIYEGENDKNTFASYLIRVVVDRKKATPRFVNYFLGSSLCRNAQIVPHIAQQVGQANFSGGKLKKIKILLPSLADQKKVVVRLDKFSAKLKKLEEYQKSTDIDLIRLEQSILHKAFSGV